MAWRDFLRSLSSPKDISSPVTFDRESKTLITFGPFPKEMEEGIRGFVQSSQYLYLREFLLHQSLLIFRDAREQKSADLCVCLNNVGRAFENIVRKLDTYKISEEENIPIDTYET